MTMDRTKYESGMRQVQAESGGVLSIRIVRQIDVLDAVADALAGDREAAILVQCVSDTVTRVSRASRRKPALCACCPRRLRGAAYCVGIAFPNCDDPTCAFGFGICDRCGPPGADLHAKAIDGIRRLWPDARQIEISHGLAGHA